MGVFLLGYLICNKCGGYYELKLEESSDEFVLKCNCGGVLKLYDNLNDYQYDEMVGNSDLENILLNDPEGAKRAHVAYLLGETKDPKYVDVLCKATEDNNGNVRRLSASALGKIGDIRAEDALINLLNDIKPQVRQYSVKALGKIKSKKAIKYLKNMKNDKKSYVVRDVEYALSCCTDTNLYDQKNGNTLIMDNGEQKSLHYHNMAIIGGIIGIIGLLGFYFSHISLIILFVGAVTFSYGYNKNKSRDKGIVGKSIVKNYLNQLPEEYIIYNNVKLPGSYVNIDHVVIGLNGIFVIESKNYNGFFIVKNKEWFYKTGRTIQRTTSNPGKQVLANSISLRKFLIDNGINMDGIWIQSIVTLVNKNFKIVEKTKHYTILFPETIPGFIKNSNKKIDNDILKQTSLLIKSCPIKKSYKPTNNTVPLDYKPTTLEVKPAIGFTGDIINLIAILKDLHSNTPLQGKNIQFKINNDHVGEVTMVNGVATLPFIIKNNVGSYTISGEFFQDDTYHGSSSTNILNVVDITPPEDHFILHSN